MVKIHSYSIDKKVYNLKCEVPPEELKSFRSYRGLEKLPVIDIINLNGKDYPMGYKVVTEDLKSLGLRRNSNIIAYSINEWCYLPKNKIKEGPDDWGGIWVARTLSNAKTLKKYYEKNHLKSARVFKAALDEILHFNSYRIKTNSIMMLEEIKW
ncbi:MAG: hypothetical protein KKF74_03730 [Nanoarchaeota archaeon]|nr:hypothetical protein [Nanoarchaeota archaeon]